MTWNTLVWLQSTRALHEKSMNLRWAQAKLKGIFWWAINTLFLPLPCLFWYFKQSYLSQAGPFRLKASGFTCTENILWMLQSIINCFLPSYFLNKYAFWSTPTKRIKKLQNELNSLKTYHHYPKLPSIRFHCAHRYNKDHIHGWKEVSGRICF